MPRFMIGSDSFLLFRQHIFASSSHEDLVACVLEIMHVDFVFVVTRGPKGRLVDKIPNVRASEPDACSCKSSKINLFGERHVPGMDFE